MEGQVKKRLDVAYEAEAKEKGIPVDQVREASRRHGQHHAVVVNVRSTGSPVAFHSGVQQ